MSVEKLADRSQPVFATAVKASRRLAVVVRWPLGGILTFVQNTYPYFDRNRWDITIVYPDLPESSRIREFVAQEGFESIVVPMEACASNELRIARRFSKALRGHQFAIVHSHGFAAGTAAALHCWARRVPHFVTVHFPLESSVGVQHHLAAALVCASVDHIHCVSGFVRDGLKRSPHLRNAIAKKSSVHVPGVVAESLRRLAARDFAAELALPREAFFIGFFGRFMPEKGFEVLLKALAKLIASGVSREPHLLAFGQGAYIREIQSQVAMMPFAGQVHFLPEQSEVGAAMRGVDVVVVPSLWEAQGFVPVEALIAGVPLIVSDCPPMVETAKGSPSRITPRGDHSALAAALAAEIQAPTKPLSAAYWPEAARRFDARTKALALEKQLDLVAAVDSVDQGRQSKDERR